MIKIGITGGIGSGKTYICKLFEKLNVPVYYADIRAKELMNSDEKLINAIKNQFGHKIYSSENTLDRAALAAVVFSNKEKLEELNRIVHPAVAADYLAWCKAHSSHPYTLKEAALLFETGQYKKLDKTILVHADKDLRILRVMQRDKVRKEQVEARMKNQLNDASKMEKADFILHNDQNSEVFKTIEKLHSYFNPSIAI